MNKRQIFLFLLLTILGVSLSPTSVYAQRRDNMQTGFGNNDRNDRNMDATEAFRSDSVKKDKEIPVGLRTWTIDNTFGDRTEVVPDTLSEMFMNTVFTEGLRGEYNTTGNLGAPRQARIFVDRAGLSDYFFYDVHDFFFKPLSEHRFTNTFSPITNVTYLDCGDKTNGEDVLKAKFAVNANKQLGFGFNIDYLYGRGYYSSQSTSHFGGSIYGSYLGDRYNAHIVARWNDQKLIENGGIIDDELITHPEKQQQQFRENEIPVMLDQNYNRMHSNQVLFAHRYMIGFNRKVPMTEEEIKAKKFAMESKIDNDTVNAEKAEPVDTTWTKNEYVPVTSFFHTLDINNLDRSYISKSAPATYYANNYINEILDQQDNGDGTFTDSWSYKAGVFEDKSKWFSMRNTLGISMLEGFNKWAKAGIKIFATHELHRLTLPDEHGLPNDIYTCNDLCVGGQLAKHQGQLFHFDATAWLGVLGTKLGDFQIDGNADLNFKLFGDTISLAANAFIHSDTPGDLISNYHSHAFWWDNKFKRQLHSHLEGNFTIERTRTNLRVAADNLNNYTYLTTSYTVNESSKSRLYNAAKPLQTSENIMVYTAQLSQNFKFGPLNWHNVLTWQESTNKEILPLPSINLYTNLFLRFRVAHVLDVDLGADLRYFTKYRAPEYVPGISAYAVRTYPEVEEGTEEMERSPKIGNYPIVNVYANMMLKGVRFYVMMSHINATAGNYFLAAHYPINTSVLRLGVSWTFRN